MLPSQFHNLRIKIKYHLSSYRACSDCKYAIHKLRDEQISFLTWKIEWAGICSILKASLHLMRYKDAKSCMPEVLRKHLIAIWNELGNNKDKYPIVWQFIDKERNNILKEYDFSAYSAIISEDGTLRTSPSLLNLMADADKQILIIRGGYYDGQKAIEVALEAVDFMENILLNAIRGSGYDPEQEVVSQSFIVPVEVKSNRVSLLTDIV